MFFRLKLAVSTTLDKYRTDGIHDFTVTDVTDSRNPPRIRMTQSTKDSTVTQCSTQQTLKIHTHKDGIPFHASTKYCNSKSTHRFFLDKNRDNTVTKMVLPCYGVDRSWHETIAGSTLRRSVSMKFIVTNNPHSLSRLHSCTV